jgi:hypothetical protein
VWGVDWIWQVNVSASVDEVKERDREELRMPDFTGSMDLPTRDAMGRRSGQVPGNSKSGSRFDQCAQQSVELRR